MSVKVQKYLANMGKSVLYSTTDILTQKFEYVNDFKNENQEVMKQAYSSIKDYKQTLERVKKTITNNKLVDAARVGFDSVVYSITTGDFYAKNKETEITEKYGGDLLKELDIDDDGFDWGNEDLSTGDKVIATAIKKNSKISTAMTAEAIVKTGKAQIDVSKENMMLMYTQNERLINKLDGGLSNITSFLKQNAESNAKIQNQMNENLNKFMTNVDNNVAKLTKQMDELLEMQRNMYKPEKKEEKKKVGYDDIIKSNGVINIKEYLNLVKKNAFNTINDASGNMLSMLFGDMMGNNSNLMAQFASAPFRSVMETLANKALGNQFDKAAKELNTTLEGIVPSIMARLNSAGKKDDNGILGMIGKIFGIKRGSKEDINPGKYNKGAIPFDGITKRTITDVIPFYLRKMTSVLTGMEEQVYDYNTGRWTTMRAVKKDHYEKVNSAQLGTERYITQILEREMGGRKLTDAFAEESQYKAFIKSIESLAAKFQSSGSFSGVKKTDLNGTDLEVYEMLKDVMKVNNDKGKDRRYKTDANGNYITNAKGERIESGLGRSDIVNFDKVLRDLYVAQNAAIKSLNENTENITRFIEAEGHSGSKLDDYQGKDYVDRFGDMDKNKIRNMPMYQVLIRAKDEYGVTLYGYLRDMGRSLRVIKGYSGYLGNLSAINANTSDGIAPELEPIDMSRVLNSGTIKYDDASRDAKESLTYYQDQNKKAHNNAVDKWRNSVEQRINKAKEKNKAYAVANTAKYKSEGENEIGLRRIVSDARTDAEIKAQLDALEAEERERKEKYDKLGEVIGTEKAKKLKSIDEKFDMNKGLRENLEGVDSFSGKLLIFGKWMNEKVFRAPRNAAVDSILKVDYWLQKVIYGDELESGEEGRKSLFQRIKTSVDEHFKHMTDKLQETIQNVTKKITDSEAFKAIKKFFLGEQNDEGIYSGGLFGSFVGGVQKGLRKNGKDVWDYNKKLAEEKARKLGLINKENASTEETSTSYSSSSSPSPTPESITFTPEQQKQQQRIDETKFQLDKLKNKILTQENYINQLKGKIQDLEGRMNTFNPNDSRYTFEQYKTDAEEYYAYRNEIRKEEESLNKLKKEYNKLVVKYNSLVKQAKKLGIQGIEKIATMAAGGINKTGKPFQSVLSAGEYLNGDKITQTGIYTIPKNGVVYNPADSATRSKQARNEKNLLNRIRSNANANDNLATITDKNQRAEFYGEMTSRGIIGGGIGLLAGGPLLGAAIGAASSLTNSTNSFANLLFGNAIIDKKTGEVKVDDNGKIKRDNEGLISKELMNAVPQIKKFGLSGLITGLLTPIGPLGGVLAGAALGFAKQSELFQGSLFGEGGVISDDKIEKLKKGKTNIALGAALTAFTGPFGIVGNALLGATAGYVTSTDKFKDAILGKKDNPDDPESKRHGGAVGYIKSAVRPLKDFGKTVINDVTDAIFGKKTGEGDKREGGLFGIVKDEVISPLADGTKSILKEFQNKIVDFGFLAKDIWKALLKRMSGGDVFGLFGEYGSKLASGAINLAKGGAKVALAPVSGVAKLTRGIGNRLKEHRIITGRADDMTAQERLKFRGSYGINKYDDYSTFDQSLVTMSNEDMQLLMDRLSYTIDGKDAIANEEIGLNNNTEDRLADYLMPSEKRKLIKLLKDGNYKDAERYIKTTKFVGKDKQGVTKEQRNDMLNILKKYKKDKGSIEKRFNLNEVKEKLTNEELSLQYGLNVDIAKAGDVDKLKRYLKRQIIHNEAGKTEEDEQFDKLRDFWSEEDTPLKIINSGVTDIVTIAKDIYNVLRQDKSQEPYESDKNLNDTNEKITEMTNHSNKVLNDVIEQRNKIKNKPTNRYMSKLEGIEGNEKLKQMITTIAERAANIFRNTTLKEISDKDRIQLDIDEFKDEYRNNNGKDFEGTKYNLTRKEVSFKRGKNNYLFDVRYEFDANSGKIEISAKQSKKFDLVRDLFIDNYIQTYMPKSSIIDGKFEVRGIIDMAKKSVKGASYIVAASIIPGGIFALAGIYAAKQLNRALDLTGKANKAAKSTMFKIKYNLGDHEVDKDSKSQKFREKIFKSREKARKALTEAIRNNDARLDEIAQEKYQLNYKDLDEKQQTVVDIEFMDRYEDEKRNTQILGHGLKGNIKAAGRKIKDTAGTMKSKVVSKVREAKLKEQEEETKLGKFFDKLDKFMLAKEKEKYEGKQSKLAKLLKWLFIGGIAVPILVGFAKDKLMPAMHEKIQPWLSDFKDKLIGVKNSQTDEYEGGLVSGIVNPIRNCLKDKFKSIHDWFSNEGEFSAPNKGMSGFLLNIKGIAEILKDYWISGLKTAYNDCLGPLLKAFGYNLLDGVGYLASGLAERIGDVIAGRKKGEGQSNLLGSNGNNVGQLALNGNSASSITLNDTMGGTVTVDGVGSPTNSIGNIFSFVNSKNNYNTTTNEDGTTTYKNENGKSYTTQAYSANEVYSIGTNNNDTTLYKPINGGGQTLIYDDATGQYIPTTDYMMTSYDNYNTESMQHLADLQNNGELNADFGNAYNTSDYGIPKVIIGQTIRSNARRLAGKELSVAGRKAATEAAEKAAREATEKGLKGVAFKKYVQEAAEKGAINKVKDKVGKEAAEKAAKSYGKKAARKTYGIGKYASKFGNKAKGFISKKMPTGVKVANGITKVTSKATEIVSDATVKFQKKMTEMIQKAAPKMKEFFSNIFKKAKGFFSKGGKELADESIEMIAKGASEGVEKGLKEATEKGGKEIVEHAAKVGAKNSILSGFTASGVGAVVSIAIAVADFLFGIDNCRNILGIITEEPSFTERLLAGIINTLQDIPVIGIGVGIMLAIDFIRNLVLNFILPILSAKLDPILKKLGLGTIEDIIAEREEAKNTLEAYNEANNTSLSIEQYNKLIGNITVTETVSSAAKDFGSAIFGYDSASKNSIAESISTESANKTIEKIKKKLTTIFSSIWQNYGEKDFNYSIVTNSEGEELEGEEKLNSNKMKFNNVSAQIIDRIVQSLNGISDNEDKLNDIYSNVCDFTGYYDSKFHLKSVYNKSKKRADKILNCSEEIKDWKRVKAMSGVAGILKEIFEKVDSDLLLTAINAVITVMSNAYFTEESVRNWGANLDTTNQTYAVNPNGSILSNYVDTSGNIDINNEYTKSNPTATDDIVTNANANNKLSSLYLKGKKSNDDSDIGSKLTNLISKSINGVTGNFDKFSTIFESLEKKNKSINDSIDDLRLLPTDKKYWEIQLDGENKFASGLYNFLESMNRVVKAPFAMAAASLGGGLKAITSSSSDSSIQNNNGGTNTNTSDTNNTNTGTTSSSNESVLKKLYNGAKTVGNKILSALGISGKGKGDDDDGSGLGGDTNDPFHVYQRDFHSSYKTAGDSENQTVADSGCGPAAAVSLLKMYGKKGDMNNAVNYALHNNYKEVNGGTYPQFFSSYLHDKGISTNPNANNEEVLNNLVNNKPVILMGKDKNNSGNTPYGSKYSHYVVARGIDKNGNVIVEDSEDKKGSTRYSLAETLKNSTVKITTGNGKYGRGSNRSVAENYVTGVTAVASSAVSSIIANAVKAANSVSGKTASNGNQNNNNGNNNAAANASTNGVAGELTPDSDVKTSCGYTADQLLSAIKEIHPEGCSAEQFPSLAISLEGSKGLNALFTIAVAIQEHGWNGTVGVNTSGANWGNYNVFNMQGSPNSSNGRWQDFDSLEAAFNHFGDLIMGGTYYGAGLTTPAKIGNRYCPPTAAENAGYSPWGEAVCSVANNIASHISTGKGKGVRPSITSKFMKNINNTIGYYTAKTVAALSNPYSSSSNSGSNQGNNNNNNVNNGNVNVDIDASTCIICGDSITYGLSSTSLGKRAMGLSSGTTDKNNSTNAGTYDSIFGSKSDIISGATDAIFFWGMNEVHTNMSTQDYFARYQDSIDTILGYGGKSSSNTNIYILPVIWVPENSGYGGSYSASQVEAFNAKYIKPFAESKGYPYVDIYEDSKNVPHNAGDVHPSNYTKLYEIIKAHMSGGGSSSTESTEENTSGSGRGIFNRKEEIANIINKYKSKSKIEVEEPSYYYSADRQKRVNSKKLDNLTAVQLIKKKKRKSLRDKVRFLHNGKLLQGREYFDYFSNGRPLPPSFNTDNDNTSGYTSGSDDSAIPYNTNDSLYQLWQDHKNDDRPTIRMPSSFFGSGRGKDDEKDTSKSTTDTENTDASTEDTESTETTDTSTSSSSSDRPATGLLSLLKQYTKALTKGVFGDFYDALYGSEVEEGNNNGNNNNGGSPGSGDARKMLGYSLTLQDEYGRDFSLSITEDEAELYEMLTGECSLNSACSCGVIANWEQECGINQIRKTATKGKVTYGGGIMQWTPPTKHTQWASENGYGNDPWSWEANKAHAAAELNSGAGAWNRCLKASPSLESKGFTACGSMDDFRKLTNAEDAAVNYERAFEGSYCWNGRTSENVPALNQKDYYDLPRRMYAKILYEIIVNGKGTKGGSGRGKGTSKEVISNTINKPTKITSQNNNTLVGGTIPRESPSKINSRGKAKYGRAIWGRAADSKTNDTKSSSTNNTDKEDSETTDEETTDEETTTDSTSSKPKSGAEQLISKLGTYAKTVTRGVFGNFYDALYGNDTEESNNDDNGNDDNSGSYKGGDVIYAAMMVFEALYKADPSLTYSQSTHHDLTCRDGTVIEFIRPDCSGLMTAVVHYMGYYTPRWSASKSYTDSYHGDGFCTANFTSAENKCIYDKDGNISNDWEVVKFDASDTRPGDIRFAASHGHTDMYIFDASNGKRRGANAGSHNGMVDTYNLSQYFFENNNQLPTDGQSGAVTIQDNDCKLVLRYKGSGSGKYGRGKGNAEKELNIEKLNKIPLSNKPGTDNGIIPISIARKSHITYANDPLKSLDSMQDDTIVYSGTGRGKNHTSSNSKNTFNNTRSNRRSLSGRGIEEDYLLTESANNSTDLSQVIQLIQVIADNSDKIDTIIGLLTNIAYSTGGSGVDDSSNSNDKMPGFTNGLSALRNALNSNSSGQDIIDAVYQIAKS